jgi:septum site-determining protein MinD
MGKVVGIISIKGGVGKTTLTASLATALASNYGKKVLAIDANFSAPNLGIHLDVLTPEKTIHDVLSGKAHLKDAIHSNHGIDLIPGSFKQYNELPVLKLKDKISSLKEDYDFVILDSSPSLNEEVLSTILASDHLFVVTTPDYPTLSCSIRAAKLAKQRGKPIEGIIINKIRDPDYELRLDDIQETLELPVVARIPDDKANTRALFTRTPIPIYDKRSKFSKEINKLAAALALEEEKEGFWKRIFSQDLRKEHVNRALLKDNLYKSAFSKSEKEDLNIT